MKQKTNKSNVEKLIDLLIRADYRAYSKLLVKVESELSKRDLNRLIKTLKEEK